MKELIRIKKDDFIPIQVPNNQKLYELSGGFTAKYYTKFAKEDSFTPFKLLEEFDNFCKMSYGELLVKYP